MPWEIAMGMVPICIWLLTRTIILYYSGTSEYKYYTAVEPLNNEHIKGRTVVFLREVVPISEVAN